MSQSIQAPSSTNPGTTYPIRANPSLRSYNVTYRGSYVLRSIPFGLTPGSSPWGCPWIPSESKSLGLHDLEPPQGQCLWPWPSAPSWSVSSRMHASPWVPSRSRSLGLVSMSLGLTSIPTATKTLTPQLPQQVNSRTSKFLSSYYKRSPPLGACEYARMRACTQDFFRLCQSAINHALQKQLQHAGQCQQSFWVYVMRRAAAASTSCKQNAVTAGSPEPAVTAAWFLSGRHRFQ